MGCQPETLFLPPPPQLHATATSAAPFSPKDIAPGHLLVELRPGVTLRELASSVAMPSALPGAVTPLPDETGGGYQLGGIDLVLVRPIALDAAPGDVAGGPIFLFRLIAPDSDGHATQRALSQVGGDARVRRVEFDRVRHATMTPNDPLLSQQWNLNAIHMPAAWNRSVGSSDVVVAVLDTGIVPGHPDLDVRLVPGYDFISTPESAADGDNRRDDDPTDTGGIDSSRLHGTHVAGIIGAATNNGIGIAGIDQRCRIMPVRVLGVRGGDGLDSDVADAVRWSSGIQVGELPPPVRKADVLNLSFGGPMVSFTLQRVLDQAIAAGVIVVVAAGNGSVDVETFSPGGLDSVISVGAAMTSGARADYSNYGPRIDLLAPGGDDSFDDAGNPLGILSTYRDEGQFENPEAPLYSYYPLSGTSQASPHVAAAASLSRALWPGLRQAGFAALLALSADANFRCDRDPLRGCGAGLLDVAALLDTVQAQADCGCSGGQICLDGQNCADPPQLHGAHFPDNTLRSGGCAVAGTRAHDAQAGAAWLFAAGLWGIWAFWRRARRAEQGASR